MSPPRQGEKQREVCERTVLLTQVLANAEQIELCPPIRLPTSAPLPKEREKEGERGHNSMRKEKKTRRLLLLPPFTIHLLLLG